MMLTYAKTMAEVESSDSPFTFIEFNDGNFNHNIAPYVRLIGPNGT